MRITMEGTVRFYHEEKFLEVVETLYHQKHINNEGFFVDNEGTPISPDVEPNIDREMLCISLPSYTYTDLDPKSIFGKGAVGSIIAASTDNCFTGWVYLDGDELTIDLNQFARENYHVRRPEDNNDVETWQNEVIDLFMEDA